MTKLEETANSESNTRIDSGPVKAASIRSRFPRTESTPDIVRRAGDQTFLRADRWTANGLNRKGNAIMLRGHN